MVKRFSELKIEIAEIGCEIRTDNAVFLQALKKRYRTFLFSGKPDFVFEWKAGTRLAPSRTPADKPLVETALKNGALFLRRFDNPFIAEVDLESGRGTLTARPNEHCFDSFLRIFFSMILASRKGVILHATGLAGNGKGFVFFGPSGSGKTTIARSSGNHALLSDELVVIREKKGGFTAHGTPFRGEFAGPGEKLAADLVLLCLLKKDTRNSLVPMDRGRALKEIFSSVLFFGGKTPYAGEVFSTCWNLVHQLPLYELHFKPDGTFWNILQEIGG